MRKETPEQRAAADAAYERGWIDSLDAYIRSQVVPIEQRYWYHRGWDACAKYRWTDRIRNGVAPDRTYRVPRDPRS